MIIHEYIYFPTAANNFISGVQIHELEATLEIPTWSEINRSLGASEMAVTRVIFLAHLAILPYMDSQMILVV
jgi:hypothetical protein